MDWHSAGIAIRGEVTVEPRNVATRMWAQSEELTRS
jgi:hypothetical protein